MLAANRDNSPARWKQGKRYDEPWNQVVMYGLMERAVTKSGQLDYGVRNFCSVIVYAACSDFADWTAVFFR